MVQKLSSIIRTNLLPYLLVLQVIIHAPFMNVPASGHHVWRQCNTLAVAKNYHEIDQNILYPRIDKTFGTNGITGPQFTSYDYTLSVLYRMFGFSEFTHRYFSLILSLLAIWGMFKVAQIYFKDLFLANLTALSLIGIPEFYYYSINAVPDLLALAAMLWAWHYFYQFLEKPTFSNALFCGLLLGLAGMTKLMFLVPGFVFLGEIIRRKVKSLNLWLGIVLIAGLSIIPSYGWYQWAKYLTSINGIHEFVHQIRFLPTINEAFSAFLQNIFSDTVETWVGYPLLIFVFGGLFIAFRTRDLRVYLSILAAILYYAVMQHQLQVHGYYMLVFVPFIALSVGYFFKTTPRYFWVALILVCLSPIWSVARMSHNYGSRVPAEFLSQNNRIQFQQWSTEKKQWIVGPDETGCVYFYYLQAKGYPWDAPTTDSLTLSRFSDWIFKEGDDLGLITDRMDLLEEISKKLNVKYTVLHRQGSFHWVDFQEISK